MANERKPSIFHNRSRFGSERELDEYGVWVKSESEEFISGSGTVSVSTQFPSSADAKPAPASLDYTPSPSIDTPSSSNVDLSAALLLKVAEELASVKAELAALKAEFEYFNEARRSTNEMPEDEAPSEDASLKVVPLTEQAEAGGFAPEEDEKFFKDSEHDDKVVLTSEELDLLGEDTSETPEEMEDAFFAEDTDKEKAAFSPDELNDMLADGYEEEIPQPEYSTAENEEEAVITDVATSVVTEEAEEPAEEPVIEESAPDFTIETESASFDDEFAGIEESAAVEDGAAAEDEASGEADTVVEDAGWDDFDIPSTDVLTTDFSPTDAQEETQAEEPVDDSFAIETSEDAAIEDETPSIEDANSVEIVTDESPVIETVEDTFDIETENDAENIEIEDDVSIEDSDSAEPEVLTENKFSEESTVDAESEVSDEVTTEETEEAESSWDDFDVPSTDVLRTDVLVEETPLQDEAPPIETTVLSKIEETEIEEDTALSEIPPDNAVRDDFNIELEMEETPVEEVAETAVSAETETVAETDSQADNNFEIEIESDEYLPPQSEEHEETVVPPEDSNIAFDPFGSLPDEDSQELSIEAAAEPAAETLQEEAEPAVAESVDTENAVLEVESADEPAVSSASFDEVFGDLTDDKQEDAAEIPVDESLIEESGAYGLDNLDDVQDFDGLDGVLQEQPEPAGTDYIDKDLSVPTEEDLAETALLEETALNEPPVFEEQVESPADDTKDFFSKLDAGESAPWTPDVAAPEQTQEAIVPPKTTRDTPENPQESPALKNVPVEFKKELKTVLSYMDILLEALPEDKIEEFARSEHFDQYKKLFTELGLI